MVGYDKYKLLLDFDTNKDAVLGIEWIPIDVYAFTIG